MKNLNSFIILFTLCIFFSGYAQSIETPYKKGEKKFMLGHYDEAIQWFNIVLEVDPKHVNALYKRAICFSLKGKYEEAVSDFTKVIALNPGDINSYLSRGSAKNKLKRYESAMDDFNKVLILNAGNTEALNNRGWAKKGLGDNTGACNDWIESKELGNKEAKIILKNNFCEKILEGTMIDTTSHSN